MTGLPLGVIKYLYIGIAVIYFILPHDLDVAGLIGRIDDVAVAGFLYYKYHQLKKRYLTQSQAAEEELKQDQQKKGQTGPLDPYETLGVEKTASLKEIEKKYKELAGQYHPDRVNHLGPELQELAHQKMLLIQEAYETLKKNHRSS